MLLKNLLSESVLKQLHAGPLAPYLSTFTSLLSEQGYTKFSIKVKIRFVAKLSRWLDQEHLGVNDLKLELFDHFIKYQGNQGQDPEFSNSFDHGFSYLPIIKIKEESPIFGFSD